MEPSDLPVTIYLNQRLIFDVLASLEDGFTQVSTVTTSTGTTSGLEQATEAGLGVSNVFAFLGLSLKGSVKEGRQAEDRERRHEERTHTPGSLFAKLRGELRYSGLVRDLEKDSEGPCVGDFVEFQATLRRNPLVQTLEAIESYFQSATEIARLQPQKSNLVKPRTGHMEKQFGWLKEKLSSHDTIDLIANVRDNKNTKAVLSVRPAYFVDPNLHDIIDGDFRVLGKVTRVIPAGSNDSINLLRKSRLGFLGDQVWHDLEATLKGQELPLATAGEVETIIRGPALQVIPLAIFA